MKVIRKNNRKVISILSIASIMFLSLFLTSCEGEEDTFNLNGEVIEDLNNGILSGQLSENYTLDPNTTYRLTGSFTVVAGVEFTIPAGTKIIANKGGSNIFIIVFPGAKIFINGTAEEPVTISTEDGEAGGWSGLTLLGQAHSLGIRSQISPFYGGDIEDDNSGSISYLNIIGAGNFIASDQKTDALALYGVGSNTTINNVAIINSADDAIDIYGGTVSVNNLYLENSGGHAINWNEGWDGTINNTYISDSGAFLGVLGGNFLQDATDPVDYNFPTFNNITIDPAENFQVNPTEGNTIFKLHQETGALVTGLSIDDNENTYIDINMLDGGDVNNLTINNSTPDVTLLNTLDSGAITYIINSGKDATPVNISEWNWIRRSL